ncbi:S41 family peptidase [Sorangium sp. So ce124]|uniref:S41 family peptidase n=1 Tax=Sorangium sp. So ce124 TaxID=3133280 RepID=UPI003F5D7331
MNAGFPDVCATPPVGAPIPYPNMAMNATAVPFPVKVFFSFVNALNMGSMMPTTLGDQAGTMSPFMGPGRFTMGNPKIILEGLPGINLTCPATGNNMVAGLCMVAVPSVTNVFFTHAATVVPGRIDAAALSALSAALVPSPDEAMDALLPGAVAYARIPVFSAGLSSRIYDAVRRHSAQGMAALILDLRGCAGGDLMAAIALAGDFLAEGATIASVVDIDGDETVYRSQQDRPYGFPLALLVDRRTASAAEVFAGCMKTHGRALVVGERTWGKGSVQRLLPGVAEPGAFYATVATVRLPDGEPLDGRGVDPDVEVEVAIGTPPTRYDSAP